MNDSNQRKLLLILFVLGMIAIFGFNFWGSDSEAPAKSSTASNADANRPAKPRRSPALARATARAIDYLDQPAIREESFVFNVLYFLERRFELGRWESMPERHAEFLANQSEGLPQKDLFRRLIEPDYVATPQEVAAAEDPVDQVTTLALYCREYPLGPEFQTKLRQLAVKGRYQTTHAGLAIAWARENGCGPNPDSIEGYIVDLMASGIRAGDATSDLEIERAAFLAYLGHADRVPAGFAGDLIRRQQADGGWPIEARGESNWHPTFLALWFLLETEGRGNGAPMIVPRTE